MENKDHLEKVIGAGNETAIIIAQETMNEAKKAVGFSWHFNPAPEINA